MIGVNDTIYSMLHLAADAKPAPWQVSVAFTYAANQVAELLRLPLVLFLALISSGG